jgi:hypothetical protein
VFVLLLKPCWIERQISLHSLYVNGGWPSGLCLLALSLLGPYAPADCLFVTGFLMTGSNGYDSPCSPSSFTGKVINAHQTT